MRRLVIAALWLNAVAVLANAASVAFTDDAWSAVCTVLSAISFVWLFISYYDDLVGGAQ